ncbi:hypothetical protein ACVWWQ_003230 [Rhodanobacter sp. TND4EL1]
MNNPMSHDNANSIVSFGYDFWKKAGENPLQSWDESSSDAPIRADILRRYVSHVTRSVQGSRAKFPGLEPDGRPAADGVLSQTENSTNIPVTWNLMEGAARRPGLRTYKLSGAAGTANDVRESLGVVRRSTEANVLVVSTTSGVESEAQGDTGPGQIAPVREKSNSSSTDISDRVVALHALAVSNPSVAAVKAGGVATSS